MAGLMFICPQTEMSNQPTSLGMTYSACQVLQFVGFLYCDSCYKSMASQIQDAGLGPNPFNDRKFLLH